MKHILIIEDDRVIREEIGDTLRFFDYTVSWADNGMTGCQMALSTTIDLLILDIMLPGIDGFAVCRKVKEQKPQLPVLMLTAKGQESERLLGFELGADDYLTKPFSIKELVARIKVILKRSDSPVNRPLSHISLGAVHIDFERYLVRRGQSETELSAKECRILQMLARHLGEVIGRDQILDEIWGDAYDPTPRTIDNFIRKLRKIIEENPDSPQHLITVHGAGYKLVP